MLYAVVKVMILRSQNRRISMAKKIRSDRKMSDIKYQGSMPPQPPLTRERFMGLLTKSAQPLKPDSKGIRTSESHLSDGYTDKYTSQDKTASKED